MTQKQLNNVIKFYKSGIYTRAMIDAMFDAGKLTNDEYEQVITSKE